MRVFVYILYNLLLPPLLLLGLPSFLIKGFRRGGLSRGFLQRLGFLSAETLTPLGKERPLWIHAVSVGEVLIALKLIESLERSTPELPILLTTTTTTGYRLASEKTRSGFVVLHNPVDLPWIAWLFIRRIDPIALILIESELWPNLIGLLHLRSVPVFLINARLSPRSGARYRRYRSLVKPLVSLLDGVTVPFSEDIARWEAIGVEQKKIHLTGSIKFDHKGSSQLDEVLLTELAAWLADTGLPAGSQILLGSSTHEGEEVLLALAFRTLREEFPDLALVLVPRHAERGPEIATQLLANGFSPVLRSGRAGFGAESVEKVEAKENRIWIADTTGELRTWYHLAELVVVGKSFRGGGGQNPVEPILAHRPVIVGPLMQNFADPVSELLRVDGIRQVDTDEALIPAIREFLRVPALGKEMARRGVAAMTIHAGAADRNTAWILDHLPCSDAIRDQDSEKL